LRDPRVRVTRACLELEKMIIQGYLNEVNPKIIIKDIILLLRPVKSKFNFPLESDDE
jgi:hypothetical protein